MLIRPERLHLYENRRPPTYLLLDGQQRLTALCSVILPADEVMNSLGEEIDLPRLFINVKTLKVEARKDSSPSSNNEVLLNRLLSPETDGSGLTSVLAQLSSRKDVTLGHRNGMKEFRERILQYTYPVQILENHNYAEVAEIFKRVNSQGKILVTAELELASIVPHWKGFSKHLRTFIKEVRGDGFKVDLPFYMKCLAFVATNRPAMDHFSHKVQNEDEGYAGSELERYWKQTKRSIRRLYGIFKENKIDRTELITSRNALIPIVYAIAKDNRKSIPHGLFIKWLIYSMDGGHYTQRTESVLRKDSYPLTESLPNIEKGFARLYRKMVRTELSSTVFDPNDFTGPSSKNPAMLFIYLALRHSNACDFEGRNETPIELLPDYHIHHIFPIEFMLGDEGEKYRKRHGLGRAKFKEQINDVANLTFISCAANQEIKKHPPYDYLPTMLTPRNREAHCIPKDPQLWKPEKFREFCVERRRLLAKAMNSYVRNLE